MAFRIPRVRASADADHLSLQIHLFRDGCGQACGWYIGPVTFSDDRATLPYLPRSDKTRATVAVVRAILIAAEQGCSLCLIDPEDLWEPIWLSRFAR